MSCKKSKSVFDQLELKVPIVEMGEVRPATKELSAELCTELTENGKEMHQN